MTHLENQVWLSEEDYELLTKHVRPSQNEEDNMSLAYELGRAKVVKSETLGPERVKINSSVQIKDIASGIVTTIQIVAPEHADIKSHKVSVLTPIGSALIGFKKGDQVAWKMPAGVKQYLILEVH